MRKIYLIIGLIGLILNTICGLVFTGYSAFNYISSDIVILVNTILLYYISNIKIRDAFKISFSFVLPFLGLISFILASIMKNEFKDNFLFMCILIITTFQISIIAITKKFVKK